MLVPSRRHAAHERASSRQPTSPVTLLLRTRKSFATFASAGPRQNAGTRAETVAHQPPRPYGASSAGRLGSPSPSRPSASARVVVADDELALAYVPDVQLDLWGGPLPHPILKAAIVAGQAHAWTSRALTTTLLGDAGGIKPGLALPRFSLTAQLGSDTPDRRSIPM